MLVTALLVLAASSIKALSENPYPPNPHEKGFPSPRPIQDFNACLYTGQPWEDDYRLPLNVIPDHYQIYLYPNLEDETLTGRINIWIKTTEPRNNLYLHSRELSYASTSKLYIGYVPLGEEESATEAVEFTEQFEYKPNEFLVVKSGSEIPAGSYTWHLEFTGSIARNGMDGFRVNTYEDENGNIR